MAQSNALISPEQLAREAQTAQLEKRAIWVTAFESSTKAAEAAASESNFIPGTSETPATLLAKQHARLDSQEQKQKIKEGAKFDELSILLGQDLAKLAAQHRELTTKIQEDSAVSLFDDPLLALANAFTLPWDIQARQGILQKVEITEKVMGTINSHIQQSSKTVDSVEKTVTAKGIAETSEAIKNMFIRKSAEAQVESAKLRSTAIDDVLKMSSLQADAYVKRISLDRQARDEARQIRNDAKNDARQERVESRQEVEHKSRMKAADYQLSKIADEREADATKFKLANDALLAEGKNPLNVTSYKTFKGQNAVYLDQLVNRGLQIMVSGRDQYSHGETIVERQVWRDTINYIPALPQQESVLDMQLAALNQAAVGASGAGKDKKIISANADVIFKADWIKKQSNIREGSPFKAPAYQVFTDHSPDIARNPIWAKYIAPTLVDDVSKRASISEEKIMVAAASAVLNKEVTSAEAAEFVAGIFNKSIAINNTLYDFERLAGRKQTKYGVRLNAGMSSDMYELTDKTSITAALAEEAKRQIFKNRNDFGNEFNGYRSLPLFQSQKGDK